MAKSAIMSLRIVSDAKSAVQGITKTSGSLASLAKRAAGVLAVGAAIGKLGGYIKDSIQAAGDLEQSTGAVEAIFKGSAGQMKKWADGASQSVGLTKNEFNELGSLIGAQLKNGGTAMDQLAPKTNQLISLGADLSSMFGGTSREAVEALSSALKGERDPIERYGVSLNQAKIDAEAAALGFKKVGGSLSDEANQAATLSLIMKQTADAHGNFSKEAGTMQGQQQRMAASWADISAKIGTLFLPIMTTVFGFINSTVLPVIDSFVGKLGEGGGAFSQLAAAAAPVMEILGGIFAPLIPQVAALVQGLSPMSILFQALLPVMPLLMDLFYNVADAVSILLQAVLPIVQTIGSALIPLITKLAAAVLPPLITVFSQVVSAVGPLIQVIGAALIPVINALMPVVETVFGIVQSVITTVLKVVSGVISAFSAALRGDWSTFWDSIAQIVADIWNGILDFAKRFFGDLPGAIIGALGNLGGMLVNAGRQIIDGFIGGLKGAWEKGKEFIGGIGSWIAAHKGPISYDKRLLQPAGKAIMGGLVKSMRQMMPELEKTVGDVTGTIESAGGKAPQVRLNKSGLSKAAGKQARAISIEVNFNGLVTDKVGAAREIKKIISEYDRLVGA